MKKFLLTGTQLDGDDFMENKVVVLKKLDKFGLHKKVVTPKHLALQEFVHFVNSASYVYLILLRNQILIKRSIKLENGSYWLKFSKQIIDFIEEARVLKLPPNT